MNRYSNYKKSGVEWIGEIPDHWEVKKLKYFAKILNGQDHKKVWDEKGEYPIIGTGGEFGKANKFLHKGPSVILGRKGTIDKPQYIVKPFWSVDTAYFTNILSTTDPKFFYYCCKTIQFELYKYGSAVPSMTQETLSQIPFASPPKIEQTAIANYLDDKTAQVEKLIANKQKLINLLKEEQTAIINKAVTKGINPEVKFKPSNIEWLGEVPEHWEVKKLRYVAKAQGGFAFNSGDFTENGIQLIKIGNLYQNDLCLNRQPSFLPAHYCDSYYNWSISDGDILMSMTGTLGKRDYGYALMIENTNQKFLLNQRVSKVVFDEKYLLKKLGLLILRSNYYQDQLFLLPSGTKQGNFSNEDILSIPIIFPKSLKEQQELIIYITSESLKIDSTISKIEKEIELMQEYRTALISEVVTGKIKVSDQPIQISIPAKEVALAAEIMSQLHEEPTFGRVKLQKIIYLCEYHAQLTELDSDYYRAAAGPLNEALLNKIEKQSRALQWFDTEKQPSTKYQDRIIYRPLPKQSEYEKWYRHYWGDCDALIQHIIGVLRFANTEKCEMIATLFAAWNDLVLQGCPEPGDEKIIAEVYAWHKKKQRFTEQQWLKELQFMRKQQLIPLGFGKLTIAL